MIAYISSLGTPVLASGGPKKSLEELLVEGGGKRWTKVFGAMVASGLHPTASRICIPMSLDDLASSNLYVFACQSGSFTISSALVW